MPERSRDPFKPSESPPEELDEPLEEWLANDSEELDESLFDPDAWPDDEADPLTEAILAQSESVLEGDAGMEDLGNPTDDEEDDELALDDDDLLDTEHDPDLSVDLRIEGLSEELLPILPLHLEVEVDDQRLAARVDTTCSTSWLVDPLRPTTADGLPGRRDVTIRIRGRAVQASVELRAGVEPLLVLGLDVLHSRFLLRP